MGRYMCHMSEWSLAYHVLHMASTVQGRDHKTTKQCEHWEPARLHWITDSFKLCVATNKVMCPLRRKWLWSVYLTKAEFPNRDILNKKILQSLSFQVSFFLIC